MARSKPKPVPPASLRRQFDPDLVPFETSLQAEEVAEPVLGQTRAKQALEFGLGMKSPGYHVYVAGPTRTGKTHLVRSFLQRLAQEAPPPPDWVYVHNFRQPDHPKALRLPNGGARVLAKEMSGLVEVLKSKIPELLESEDYSKQREALVSRFKKERSDIFQVLDGQAREVGYVLRYDSSGIMVAPAGEDGEPMPEARIREMDESQREQLRAKSDMLQAKVTESLRQVQAAEKEMEGETKKLERDTVSATVYRLLSELLYKYAEMPEVVGYLKEVGEDVVENFGQFKRKEKPQLPFPVPVQEPNLREYTVNVFVDNSEVSGAPVVVENNPTYPNLFGRIERQAQFGALVTDFTLLSPGVLHQANGGYLVIPILELLRMWLPWEALKRALRDGEVNMEDAVEQLGFMATRSLRPEPIPLDLKVILVGETMLYHLLYSHDHQFGKLFKVRAEMAERMDWGGEEVDALISHVCTLVRKEELLPLDRGAVARLIELAAELAGDRERLTLRLAEVEDVVREGEYLARLAGKEVVTAADIVQAVDQRRHRASMLEDRLREAAQRGFIQVQTEGVQVGQVNGLSVLDQGDYAFGQASRITASLGLGKEGVVAIDRESELSGPFHTKGVLILAGFLRDRFAGQGPLTLTASLVFEQSYGMVDGDSASLAELLALLSRLSAIPLRQDLAVTGSVSQQGQVQAIGGVNAKIEGFFRLCRERGLNGSQGVVIPHSNLPNLMLHPEVVAAAQDGSFQVYTVSDVDQALELMTGQRAGVRGKSGRFPKGTINRLIEDELARLRELARQEIGKDK